MNQLEKTRLEQVNICLRDSNVHLTDQNERLKKCLLKVENFMWCNHCLECEESTVWRINHLVLQLKKILENHYFFLKQSNLESHKNSK